MTEDFTGFQEYLIERKHSAARLLEIEDWQVLDMAAGELHVACALPEAVLNSAGMLFGGFTPTYVDLLALWTAMTTMEGRTAWLMTVNMRVDYFEPIVRPGFHALSRVLNIRKRDYLIETRLENDQQTTLAYAVTTLRKVSDMQLRAVPGPKSADN